MPKLESLRREEVCVYAKRSRQNLQPAPSGKLFMSVSETICPTTVDSIMLSRLRGTEPSHLIGHGRLAQGTEDMMDKGLENTQGSALVVNKVIVSTGKRRRKTRE